MNKVVDKIISQKGKSVDAVIPILQAIQDEYNYLPEEAMQRVCELTEISAARIYGISTFYTQFRHKPVGNHVIKVCVGTACHVKGAMLVYDALKRELDIAEDEDTDSKNEFTIDKVACLGCCTIAPVVQIDDTTFGHVEPGKVSEIIDEFLAMEDNPEIKEAHLKKQKKESEGEIRIGLGSCCVASGSEDVKMELENSLKANKTNVEVKQVGCVGICNQVPLLEIHKPNETPYYYTKIKADEVSEIVRKHFKSKNPFTRFKTNAVGFFNEYVINGTPKSTQRYSADREDTPVAEFLEGQINIATEHRGFIKPTDLNEYKNLGGFEALQKCITQFSQDEIIEKIKSSGLKGRGGGGFSTGIKWEVVKNVESDQKYVICNGDEGDPGAFMDRMLLESYPFRIIEGLMIAAYAVGAN